jgi:MFS family permease
VSLDLGGQARHVFRALRHRQFRIFWLGQAVSVTGLWMQTMALSWLVYRLTDSPLYLGLLAAARFGPSLVLSPVAGVVTDRFPRRDLLIGTQAASLVLAATLAVLTLSGQVVVWQLLVLATMQGVTDTLDLPARQTLQVDLVGLDDLQSAVSLNSSAFNSARMIGPAIAGVVVAAWGEGVCFAVNAVSYAAVLAALLAIRLPRAAPREREPFATALRGGVRFAWRTPAVRAALAAVAVTSVVGLSFSTLLPVFARDVLHSGVRGYGLLLAGAGLGSVIGALGAAARRGGGSQLVVLAAQSALGAGLIALATTRTLLVAALCLVVIGLVVAVQLTTTNGLLQTSSPPELRGRVMSLYMWLFVGASPLGGLAAGWLAERVGAPATAALAGAGCSLSALLTAGEIYRQRRALAAAPARSGGEERWP